MARRIILGRYGPGDFRIRVSEAGYDAATAPLEGLLFDADNIPSRILASGTAVVPGALTPINPGETTVSHGVSPSLVIGVARSRFRSEGFPDDRAWWQRHQLAPSQGGGTAAYIHSNTRIRQGWCTPWLYIASDSNGGSQSCGWRLAWNSTSVTLLNYAVDPIDVRWAAIGF